MEQIVHVGRVREKVGSKVSLCVIVYSCAVKARFNAASSLNEPIALALAELAKFERAVFLGGSQVTNPDVSGGR